ncbi:MAG: lysophospholipid acyltransferase family protein, partial [Rhizobacter sp.]
MMRDQLDRAWRIVATGLCFATFGLGGLLLRLVVFPLVRLATPDRARRSVRVKAIIRATFRVFVSMMRHLGVLRLEVRGLEKLRREGLLIIANHPSLVDVVFLMSFVQRADCIVKSSLARNPFTRGPVVAANFICNDSGAGLVDDCVASVRRGNNLIIFPEGSRTPVG